MVPGTELAFTRHLQGSREGGSQAGGKGVLPECTGMEYMTLWFHLATVWSIFLIKLNAKKHLLNDSYMIH